MADTAAVLDAAAAAAAKAACCCFLVNRGCFGPFVLPCFTVAGVSSVDFHSIETWVAAAEVSTLLDKATCDGWSTTMLNDETTIPSRAALAPVSTEPNTTVTAPFASAFMP
jgi:hypothetical protein